MVIKLPAPIEAYFAADRTDSEAVAGCFADDAVVVDEGQTHRGRAAIKQWIEQASTEYSFTSEPFAVENVDGKTVVTSKVSGTFPGSPINLRYFFGFDSDKLGYLEILV